MSKVDVVIPLYNSARWLEETVASVRTQRDVSWSLTLLDDGSEDESMALARQLACDDLRIRVAHQTNQGVCAARNAGAAFGRSPFLLFLDADDRLLPDGLAFLVGHLETAESLAVFGCLEGIGDDGTPRALPAWSPRMRVTRRWLQRVPDHEPATPPEAFLMGTASLPCGMLVRRDAFERVGGWDELFGQYHEDADLWARIALEGGIDWLPQTVAQYRVHSGQVSSSANLEDAQRRALMEKWRSGSVQQRRVARTVDHRFVPLARLRSARSHARAGETGLAVRFAAGALRAYRPVV